MLNVRRKNLFSKQNKIVGFLVGLTTTTLVLHSFSACSSSSSSSSSSASAKSSATPTPTPSWTATVEDGASGGNVYGYGIAVDSSFNVYVAGYTSVALDGQTLHGTQDYFISKYNSSGTRKWTVEDGASGGTVYVRGIGLDSYGNIYISGYTNAALDSQTLHGTQDLFISKYDSGGTLQWTVEDGASGGVTELMASTVDSSGNVYATGKTNVAIDSQTLQGTNDLIITKYNTSGTLQWTVEDGASGGTSIGFGIALDSAGSNVYVTGYTTAALDSQTLHGTDDLIITKYNSSGTRKWTVEDGASSAEVTGYGVAVDSSGNVYVTGTTTGALDSQTLNGTQDMFTTVYNSSGTHEWTIQDGASGGTVQSSAIVVDSTSNAYVVGYTNVGLDGNTLTGTDDSFIVKYNSIGTRQWTTEDGVASAMVEPEAIAIDSFGDLYITGNTTAGLDGNKLIGTKDLFVSEYNSSGNRR